MDCFRDAIPKLRRLAISCSRLEIHESCLPWIEETVVLQSLASKEIKDGAVINLESCQGMRVERLDQVIETNDTKLVHMLASQVKKISKEVWYPKSEIVKGVLQLHHPDLYETA